MRLLRSHVHAWKHHLSSDRSRAKRLVVIAQTGIAASAAEGAKSIPERRWYPRLAVIFKDKGVGAVAPVMLQCAANRVDALIESGRKVSGQ
jgi:hypothetical protein